jgi:hypothetical protein
LPAIRRLQRRVNDWKEGHHRDAQLHALLSHRQQQVQAQALDTGHGRDGFAFFLAVQHKHRVNQVVGAQAVFAHQAAGEIIAAQAAQSRGRE